jgi:hypothetical protein
MVDIAKIKNIYIYQWKNIDDGKHIVRMNTIYITAGEIWYVRLLLLHVVAYSFKDLIFFESIEYKSIGCISKRINS